MSLIYAKVTKAVCSTALFSNKMYLGLNHLTLVAILSMLSILRTRLHRILTGNISQMVTLLTYTVIEFFDISVALFLFMSDVSQTGLFPRHKVKVWRVGPNL
jgi:hypothetical protein